MDIASLKEHMENKIELIEENVKIVKYSTSGPRYYNKYRCYCGNVFIVREDSVRSGHTKSCGCLWIKTVTKHGQAASTNKKPSVEYVAWSSMIVRCYDVNTKYYKHYGGRGITVCDRWRTSFSNFLSDMGTKPKKELSLDRIDNDGDYRPDNCRWADRSTQARNQRRFKGRKW